MSLVEDMSLVLDYGIECTTMKLSGKLLTA